MHRAYAAGILDGEGCVQFAHNRGTIFPRVLIVNTDLDLLNAIRDGFGGDIQRVANLPASWRQSYQWRISWSSAVDFLDRLFPYIRVKQLQAQTVFAWAESRPGNGGRWDPDTLDLLTRRMTWLNKKGPILGTDPVLEAL